MRNDLRQIRPSFIYAGRNVVVYPANGTGFDLLQHGEMIWIDDWAENITGSTWKELLDNYDVLGEQYWKRLKRSNIPVDNDVLYGMVQEVPYLVHVSELGYEGEASARLFPAPILHRSFEKPIPEMALQEQVA